MGSPVESPKRRNGGRVKLKNQNVTSVVGASPQMSMCGGLCEEQIRKLFKWMGDEEILWVAVLDERFGEELSKAVGSSGTAFKLWLWASRDEKLLPEHFSDLYLGELTVDATFKRIRIKCNELRREGQ